jgi:hypothetical protein
MPPALLEAMLVGFKMMTPPVTKQMRRTFLSLAAAAPAIVMEILAEPLDKSARGVKTSACDLATPLMKGGSNFASPSD